jgi:hypothetical protein
MSDLPPVVADEAKSRSTARTRWAIHAAVGILLIAFPLTAIGADPEQVVAVSAPGEIVGEFLAATSPADPDLMVASTMVGNQGGTTHCAVYVSSDGGRAWREVPAWEGAERAPVGDPWVDISVDGVIHATCIARTRDGSRVLYTQSGDGGNAWSNPRPVTPISGASRIHSDKDALTVDGDGTIHVCFTQMADLNGPRPVVLSRSTDDGLTWTATDTGVLGLCNGVALAPNGALTVLFITTELQIATVTSLDGGDHWLAPVILGQASLDNFQMPTIISDDIGAVTIAAVVGGPTETLQVWHETGGQVDSQWDLDIPDSATCHEGRLIQPALTVAPSSRPVLQIACKLDRTRITAGRQEVWLYAVADVPGATPIPVTGFELPAGNAAGFFARRFVDGGDYWSLAWTTSGVVSMWVDPREGGGPGVLMSQRVVLAP